MPSKRSLLKRFMRSNWPGNEAGLGPLASCSQMRRGAIATALCFMLRTGAE
jgi:hypothetical protein